MNRLSEYREVVFWLLLLGSWQFLVSPGSRNTAIGTGGLVVFLLFAYRSLGKLSRLGLAHAKWNGPARVGWGVPVAGGVVAGIAILAIGSAAGQSVIVGHDWRLALLQVTLGPVLEEVVFRGYLCALLLWTFGKTVTGTVLNRLVISAAAVAFALAHLAQPGVSSLQLACITATGCLYGWIRFRSASTATAAVSHAAYNFTLYVGAGLLAIAS